jgi:hypothetical protein
MVLVSSTPSTLTYASDSTSLFRTDSPQTSLSYSTDYFTIKTVRIEEIAETHTVISTTKTSFPTPTKTSAFNMGGIIQDAATTTSVVNVILDNIINIGKKIWTLVDANRAVVNISSDRANALPQGMGNWEAMQEWKTPNSKLFHINYTNFYGMNVVDFTFRLVYTYGGTVNGKGLYLTQIGVLPAELLVRSGYTFNVQASVPSITNAGTLEAPMAAAEVLVNWSLDNYAKHIEGSQSYYVRGDGYFENISGKLEETDPENSTTNNPNSNSNGYDDSTNDADPFAEESNSIQ